MRLIKRTGRVAVVALLALFFFVVLATSALAAPSIYTTNTSTSVGNAITNAVKLSARAYPGGAPAAVVTNASSPGDAPAAGVLARAFAGPLLLSRSSGVSSSVTGELARLQPASVYVVGLSSAVGSQIAAALAGLPAPPQVVVLTGSDRYHTAALVANQVKVKVGTVDRVMIVPGDRYAEGVVASAVAAANGWPILLTPTAGPFPQVSTDAIINLGATFGIAVGTSVSPSVDGFTVEKTIIGAPSGGDPDGRYDACAQLAEYAVTEGLSTCHRVGLVYGYDYPHGLALAPYAAGDGGLLLLSGSSSLSNATVGVLQSHGTEVAHIDMMGLWWSVVRHVKSLNSARVTALSAPSGSVSGGDNLVVTGTSLDTASSVVMGKTSVPATDWRIDGDSQLTILRESLGATTGH